LAKGAIAVLEERAANEIAWPASFQEIDRRRYGDTVIALAQG
jgi:16S rRNA G966 N2-methylase RsmD